LSWLYWEAVILGGSAKPCQPHTENEGRTVGVAQSPEIAGKVKAETHKAACVLVRRSKLLKIFLAINKALRYYLPSLQQRRRVPHAMPVVIGAELARVGARLRMSPSRWFDRETPKDFSVVDGCGL
jgi:hypothetical protein